MVRIHFIAVDVPSAVMIGQFREAARRFGAELAVVIDPEASPVVLSFDAIPADAGNADLVEAVVSRSPRLTTLERSPSFDAVAFDAVGFRQQFAVIIYERSTFIV